jgi:membrane-associated protein
MGHWIFELLRGYFDQHGYLTVFVALLLENAGIPVPGETILLFASFLAFDEQELRLKWIILIGIAACTIGDNIGYLVGKRGGRPLLNRYRAFFKIPESTIKKGEDLFHRHGNLTIFFARFIFGMRIVAGPLAGVLNMPWRRFVLFNFLGATLWVTVISFLGFTFGEHWPTLIKVMGKVNLGIGIVALWAGYAIYKNYRARHPRQKEQESAQSGR